MYRCTYKNVGIGISLSWLIYIFVDPDIRLKRERERERERAKMSESQRFQLGTIGALSLSVVSSVSIVICNKALISTLNFSFGEFCHSHGIYSFVLWLCNQYSFDHWCLDLCFFNQKNNCLNWCLWYGDKNKTWV